VLRRTLGRVIPTLITVEPDLLGQADAYAKKAGMSRSQVFAQAIRDRLAAAG
jgi:hypothetical protein